MQKRTRNLLIILGAIVVLILIAVVSSRGKHDLPEVKTQKLALTTFDTKLPESGTIQHPGVQTIPALVGGNLGRMYVRAGQAVIAGQLLATVDNPTLNSTAAGSSVDYQSAVANVSSAQVNEQNAKVQYQAAAETAKSNYDEALRIYTADNNLYQNKAIARNQVDIDRAKMDQSKVQYDQAVRQLQLGAVSGYGQNSVQYARTAATKAQIMNSQSQEQLGFTRIVAPFSGIIQTVAAQPSDPLRTVQTGDPISAGQAIFTIASGGGFIVKAQVDEQDIINVKVGQKAVITGEDFPNHNIAGHVGDIAPVATKSTDASSTAKQVLTTIVIDASPNYLKDGMSANVDIYTAHFAHVVTVPNGAIVSEKGKSVWVVRDGKLHKAPIKTGLTNESVTIVTSGVVAGDRIVTQPNPALAEGTAVKIAPAASPSPATSGT
ncbi:MAG: efflux RND transporter periplasmic adaptor subunit [Candidatus Eremiobacteraeota bacterium]|nr:efflux RND transporter periplasmic adaptor subunit [Candidatus Eremiobacteraeota bacterium]